MLSKSNQALLRFFNLLPPLMALPDLGKKYLIFAALNQAVMETVIPELTPFDLVKIYEKHGMKITVDEAREILDFMDKMIKLVKKQLNPDDENRRFIYTSKH